MSLPATGLRATILGCGSSGGVPRVAAGWGACDPSNPKNRRRRCSMLVERTGPGGITSVLVDVSPDLREQLLGANVTHLDAVLVTHEHADHTHGIDDLRPLVLHMRRKIPLYADDITGTLLRQRFGYCFEAPPGSGYPPIVTEHRIEVGREIVVDGAGGSIAALPFRMVHGDIDALGFRIGNLGYASDVSALPPESMTVLRDLDVLIVDALRDTPHPTHFSVSDARAVIEELQPRRAILTNLNGDLDYEALKARLPDSIVPAHDGLTVEDFG